MPTPDNWPFIITNDNVIQNLDYDVNGNIIYQGWAQPGSSASASVWRIKHLTYNGSNQLTNITFPQDVNGQSSTGFAFIWANRTTYTYS